MVIVKLWDPINGHRYRKISYKYYLHVCEADLPIIEEAFIVPNTVEEF